jgi:hypothetical protein
LVLGLLASTTSLAFTVSAQAATPAFAHFGKAFGTRVTVGTAVTSGQTWPAGLGACSAHTGDRGENTGAGINIPNVAVTGTIDNKVTAFTSLGVTSTRATSDVQNVNLLGGAVQATALEALSQVNYGSGFAFRNGSFLAGLSVLGHAVGQPAPNTRIDLPGIGYVILNETTQKVTPTFAEQIVNLIHVFVTVPSNTLGLSTGTQIVVGHAEAGLSIPLGGGPVGGTAYGTLVRVGSLVTSGQSAPAGVPCLGGKSQNQILSTSVPNLFTTDTILDTGSSTLTATLTSATSESTVQGANLLGGLIQATVIKSHAHGTFDGTTHKFDPKVTFTSLVVSGVPVLNPGVNAQITISGLGTLYLNRVIQGTRSIEVRALELVVTVPNNSFGLANGTDIRVAVSSVSFRD